MRVIISIQLTVTDGKRMENLVERINKLGDKLPWAAKLRNSRREVTVASLARNMVECEIDCYEDMLTQYEQ